MYVGSAPRQKTTLRETFGFLIGLKMNNVIIHFVSSQQIAGR
jgi:hypothetical protein